MLRSSIVALLVVFIAATQSFSKTAFAQAPDCTYDRCALRLQSRVFSEHLVQGADATPLARLGLFAPRIEPLATAADSARRHYEVFRSYQNRGAGLRLLGFAATLVSTIVYVSDKNFPYNRPRSAFWGFLGVGLTFSIVGGINISKGRDQLHQAIWFYNRSLRLGQ